MSKKKVTKKKVSRRTDKAVQGSLPFEEAENDPYNAEMDPRVVKFANLCTDLECIDLQDMEDRFKGRVEKVSKHIKSLFISLQKAIDVKNKNLAYKRAVRDRLLARADRYDV